jgi:hypothetical protein
MISLAISMVNCTDAVVEAFDYKTCKKYILVPDATLGNANQACNSWNLSNFDYVKVQYDAGKSKGNKLIVKTLSKLNLYSKVVVRSVLCEDQYVIAYPVCLSVVQDTFHIGFTSRQACAGLRLNVNDNIKILGGTIRYDSQRGAYLISGATIER